MHSPAISVIVPCFNGSIYLGRCVQSVLEQGCDAEIVIVDDGSTDDSPRMAREMALAHPGRVFAVSQANAGQAAARNVGIRLASGKYICFLDVDDEYAPGALSAAQAILDSDHACIGVEGRMELPDLRRTVEPWQLGAMESTVPGNVMIRAEVVRMIGGFSTDPAFRGRVGGEDGCFRLELLKCGRVMKLDRPFLRYHVHRGDHADYFLSRTVLQDGKLAFTEQSPEERDGTLFAAFERYVDQVARRRLDRGIERIKTQLDAAFEMMRTHQTLQAVPGSVEPLEGFALGLLARQWAMDGRVIQVGPQDARATCWLATGVRAAAGDAVVVAGDSAVAPENWTFVRSLSLEPFIQFRAAPVPSTAEAFAVRMLFVGNAASEAETSAWSRYVQPHGLLAMMVDAANPHAVAMHQRLDADKGTWTSLFGIQRLKVLRRLPRP